MANVDKMWVFLDMVASVVAELAEGDPDKKDLMNTLIVRILSILDGVEGPDLEWKGIALVAQDDLPDDVDTINDDFLHDAWCSRKDS